MGEPVFRSDDPIHNNSYAMMRGDDINFSNLLILNEKIKYCHEMDGDGVGIEVAKLRHKWRGNFK
jgi:hypothetical protein